MAVCQANFCCNIVQRIQAWRPGKSNPASLSLYPLKQFSTYTQNLFTLLVSLRPHSAWELKKNQWVIFSEDKEYQCIFIPEVLIVLY